MKRFCVSFLILSIFLTENFCPALAQGKKSKEDLSSSSSSQSLYGPTKLDQLSTSDPVNQQASDQQSTSSLWSDEKAPYKAPPGAGPPVGGVTPIGHGFRILMWLSFCYMFYIYLFKFRKSKKMNKTIATLFIVLSASVTQTYGQAPIPPPGVPATAKRIYFEDFGGNRPGDAVVATKATADSILRGRTTLTSVGTISTANNPPDNGYALAQSTKGAAYGVWWGNGSTAAYTDHDAAVGRTPGYMMVVNAAADTTRNFFKYTIKDLCPNTHLYFSVWAGNAVRSPTGRDTPKLVFVIADPLDSTHVYRQSDKFILNETTTPTWVPLVFDFTSSTDSITLRIFDKEPSTNGNDLVMDDIEIWLDAPSVTTSGRLYYCDGEYVKLKLNYDITTIDATYGADDLGFQWFYTPALDPNIDPATNDYSAWSPVGNNETCTDLAKEGYYVGLIGTKESILDGDHSCCSVADTVQVHFIPPNDTLYWVPQGVSQNWNDPQNWVSKLKGMAVSPYAPSVCTDVHIPGNSKSYPSLDLATSMDESACQDIWFHFGGLIGQPHLLKYHHAYVQYNFGISDESNPDPNPTLKYSSTPMSRDRWYALAAPLQRMVSGDFAFGGFPFTWQNVYYTSPNQTPGTLDGDWQAVTDNTNDWRISDQYNAIVVGVDGELTSGLVTTGSYQKNLDALNGILEIPYYEDDANLQYHGVTQSGNVTSFPYFDYTQPDFPPALPTDPQYKPPGEIDRGSDEAYYFIFQDANLFSNVGSTYSLSVPANTDIMVGNPFMSDLDFDRFAVDNGINSYYLYYGNSFNSFVPYNYHTGTGPDLSMRYIAPLQAFFINTGSSSGAVKPLLFNADNIAVAPNPVAEKLRASTENTKPDVLYLKAANNAGVSYLTLSMQNVEDKNLILLLRKDNPGIPSLYATDDAKQKNCIQFLGGYGNSDIPLGILSNSSDMVTLTVSNSENLSVDSLILYDTALTKRVDLKANNTYTFANDPAVQDRFVLTMKNKSSVTGITSTQVARPVYISASNNTLFVKAESGIKDISVITLQGITALRDDDIGQTSYTKTLQLPSGMYLVSVKLTTGETSVAKVVIK